MATVELMSLNVAVIHAATLQPVLTLLRTHPCPIMRSSADARQATPAVSAHIATLLSILRGVIFLRVSVLPSMVPVTLMWMNVSAVLVKTGLRVQTPLMTWQFRNTRIGVRVLKDLRMECVAMHISMSTLLHAQSQRQAQSQLAIVMLMLTNVVALLVEMVLHARNRQ
jgi:hypothetical protein